MVGSLSIKFIVYNETKMAKIIFLMIASKILFYLGLGIGIVGFIGNLVAAIAMLKTSSAGGLNIFFVNNLLGPLWPCGVLVGVAKILEVLAQKHSEPIVVS